MSHLTLGHLSLSGADDGALALREILKLVESMQVQVGGELIAINARHASALQAAAKGLQCAADGIRMGEINELVASDLRMAIAAFEQISGKIDNERILDELFAGFCIGK